MTLSCWHGLKLTKWRCENSLAVRNKPCNTYVRHLFARLGVQFCVSIHLQRVYNVSEKRL